MDIIYSFVSSLNRILWGPLTPALIIGTGLVLQWRLAPFLIQEFPKVLGHLTQGLQRRKNAHRGEISPFHALMTSLSATIGTGNIAGVSTAIVLGGPGAIFWMWVAGLVGLATKFAEAALAVQYREVAPDGRPSGGPMYYICKGLGKKYAVLASAYALFGSVTAFGLGNMVQANAVSDVLSKYTYVPYEVSAAVLSLSAGVVIIGGIGRIASVAGKMVPLMSALYLFAGLCALAIQMKEVPAAFASIFYCAFNGHAAVGGFVGSSMASALHYGVSRGVFSNEAGLGSAAISHASASTSYPLRQGMIAMLGTCVDTLGICTMTGLVVLTSGAWKSGLTGAQLTSEAFGSAFYGGQYLVALCLCLFAFTTILGWCFYGEKCFCYLFGTQYRLIYRFAWILALPIGSLTKLEFIWMLADVMNALMAYPNLVALVLLSGSLTKMVYDKKERSLA